MLEELIKKVLSKLEEQSEEMKRQFEMVNQRFEQIDQRFEEVNQRFEQIDQRFEEVNQRFEQIDQRFEGVNQKFVSIDEQFKKANQKFISIDEQFVEMKAEIKEIKNYLIIIEDKLSNEIPALFDGYNSNFEKNTILESRQDDTEQKVAINSLRISSLEDTSKKHSKQISKLLAQ